MAAAPGFGIESRRENHGKQHAVEEIILLLPVWGRRFVGRFLELSLPTLLSPNNIPAISQQRPCRFVFQTSAADEQTIRCHPAWQKLSQYCDTSIELIDDLITGQNHTATITLAFERALRDGDDRILNTCYLFLMSDYLVADGSLKTAIAPILDGSANCALAGNFQVVSEDAVPLLRQIVDPLSYEITLKPRELVRWSLTHLQAASLANIVNLGLMHNADTNRLFWRVDENTLIGRFFLMHPIAIHPETVDFTISASWDYSFVPELCPSNRLVTLTDSDDYLVVELQNREYEREKLRPGAIDPVKLAASLEVWATANHRRYVEKTLIFHAADYPPRLPEAIAQADAFVKRVLAAVSTPPQPHTQHPFWVGSIAVSRHLTRRPLNAKDWAFLLADGPADERELPRERLGFPPELPQAHPLWPDFREPARFVRDVLGSGGRLLLLAHDVESFADWVVRAAGDVSTLDIDQVHDLPRRHYRQMIGTLNACIAIVDERDLGAMDGLIDDIGPLLKPGGRMMILVCNDAEGRREFAARLVQSAGKLVNPYLWMENIHYVELDPGRQQIRQRIMGSPSPPTGAGALSLAIANGAARGGAVPPSEGCSSICLTLRASTTATVPLPPRRLAQEKNAKLLQTRLQPSSIAASNGAERANAASTTTELSWQDTSPGISATFEFLIRLMGERHDVAEVGCANLAGTEAALQVFQKLSLFDPRPLIVNQLEKRFEDNWRFRAQTHNILESPLPRKVDSIFSVGFMQYVARDEEEAFVKNLRDSLSRDFDFLVISCVSFEGAVAQTANSLPSTQAGPAKRAPAVTSLTNISEIGSVPVRMRCNPRSGEEIRRLMEQYFQNVFMFAVTENAVVPGLTAPGLQQIIALCCSRK